MPCRACKLLGNREQPTFSQASLARKWCSCCSGDIWPMRCPIWPLLAVSLGLFVAGLALLVASFPLRDRIQQELDSKARFHARPCFRWQDIRPCRTAQKKRKLGLKQMLPAFVLSGCSRGRLLARHSTKQGLQCTAGATCCRHTIRPDSTVRQSRTCSCRLHHVTGCLRRGAAQRSNRGFIQTPALRRVAPPAQ